MQNEDITYSGSGGESEISQSQRAQSGDTGFIITPEDADVLQEYLEEFQAADTSLRTRIIEKAMAQLYLLRPSSAPFDKKVATKKIQKWFYNHYIRPRRQYIKFTCKWSARNAFYHLHCEEVLERAREDSGTEPGNPAFLGALQDATTALWNDVSPKDQREYVDAAKEWSEKTPPKHIQSRMASSMCEWIIQDFQSQLYKTCGIRSIVLTAYEGEDNNLKIGFNDVNSVLQDGKDFQKFCPDWKSAALWEQWTQFGLKCFAKGLTSFLSQDCPGASKKGQLKDNPIPNPPCYVTGKPTLTIPWGSLVKDPSSWIRDECIPDGFEWKDPSKIQIGEVFRLLYHWSDRQDKGIDPLMWVSTSPLFSNLEDSPRPMRSVRRARKQQSPASDEECFILPASRDSDQEDDITDAEDSSDDSSRNDDSSDRTDPSEDEVAMRSPPLNMSYIQEDACPDDDGGPSPTSAGHDYLSMNRSSFPEMAGPSHSPQLQWKEMQVGHQPHVAKGKGKEIKQTIKVSEKVRNMDTGWGAAKVHPDIWSMNR
ncbi:hypothetical protein H4582DRAFT_2066492 [Lactarius indigo]|nr:hypothetical protein H4582DRAFT_2066492 [Lactarius indigo]